MTTKTRIKVSGPGMVYVYGTCTVTGNEYGVEVDFQSWKAWKDGELAQDAFPALTADQREFLISGTSPAEWNAMFGEEE